MKVVAASTASTTSHSHLLVTWVSHVHFKDLLLAFLKVEETEAWRPVGGGAFITTLHAILTGKPYVVKLKNLLNKNTGNRTLFR